MKNKEMMVLLVGALLAVSMSGCIGGQPAPVNATNATSTTQGGVTQIGTEMSDIAFQDFMNKYKQRRLFSTDGSTIPDRNAYGVPLEIFSEMPAFP
jgi:hypothetical protein